MPSNAAVPGSDDLAPALIATGLQGGYRGVAVLQDVSLHLVPGEAVALLGRNGSGKSTLLRLLSGVLPPYKGTVILEGRPVGEMKRREVARRLAVVSQELQIPFAFLVHEVVEMGRTPYLGFLQPLNERDRRAVERALATVDLAHLADRPYTELSGGEQQRAAVAMALAQEPSVLLLDEPTVHLDIAHQLELLTALRASCRQDGVAILAAMHDINLALLLFDRLIILGEGRILAEGPIDRVLEETTLEQAFGTQVIVGRHPILDRPQISLLP